jgi:CRP-like cAMP-binding protein
VVVDGIVVGEVKPGEAMGEASVFLAGDLRSGDAIARVDCLVHVLERATVLTLRETAPDRFDALLRAGLGETWRRLQAKDRQICRQAPEALVPATLPSTLRRLMDRARAPSAPPDPERALSRVALLNLAGAGTREQLAQALAPVYLPEGRALFVQGDAAEAVSVVASGAISVQRTAQGRGAVEVGVLTEGALLGAAAFVGITQHNASAVATEASWVFKLRHQDLEGIPPEARRLFHLALLAVMRQQLTAANRLAARIRRPEHDLPALLRAVGHLEGWQAGDPLCHIALETLLPPVIVVPPDRESIDICRDVRAAGSASPQARARLGEGRIDALHDALVNAALAAWGQNPAIRAVRGTAPSATRVLVRHGRGYLHSSFVEALLLDVFGIRCRSVAAGSSVLGLGQRGLRALQELQNEGWGAVQLQWTVVDFPFYLGPDDHNRIVHAVNLVGAYGYALLHRYEVDPRNGRWTPRTRRRRPLSFDQARQLMEDAVHETPEALPSVDLDPQLARWRWFPLPHEGAAWLRRRNEDPDQRGTSVLFNPPGLDAEGGPRPPRRG